MALQVYEPLAGNTRHLLGVKGNDLANEVGGVDETVQSVHVGAVVTLDARIPVRPIDFSVAVERHHPSMTQQRTTVFAVRVHMASPVLSFDFSYLDARRNVLLDASRVTGGSGMKEGLRWFCARRELAVVVVSSQKPDGRG